MTFMFALALQCFFPLFDAQDVPGLAIVNNDAEPREYSVTVANSDGLTALTGNISLRAGAQRALLLREFPWKLR